MTEKQKVNKAQLGVLVGLLGLSLWGFLDLAFFVRDLIVR